MKTKYKVRKNIKGGVPKKQKSSNKTSMPSPPKYRTYSKKEKKEYLERQKSPRSKKYAKEFLHKNDKLRREDEVNKRGENRRQINLAIGKLRKTKGNVNVGPPDFRTSQKWLEKWNLSKYVSSV